MPLHLFTIVTHCKVIVRDTTDNVSMKVEDWVRRSMDHKVWGC